MLMPAAAIEEQSAIFGDDQIEQQMLGKDALELIELPAGDKDKVATGVLQLSKCRHRLRVDDAIFRDRPVIVSSQSQKMHDRTTSIFSCSNALIADVLIGGQAGIDPGQRVCLGCRVVDRLHSDRIDLGQCQPALAVSRFNNEQEAPDVYFHHADSIEP